MATRDEIRAVFAAPQLDGLERFYDAIGEMLHPIELRVSKDSADLFSRCHRC